MFLHIGLIHLAVNAYSLYILGNVLEREVGRVRFLALYVLSGLFASAASYYFSPLNSVSAGASGAIFGIFGATFVIARGRGFDAVASSIGVVLLINLALSIGASHISLGGHLGGLAAGLICGGIVIAGDRGALGERRLAAELAVMVGVAIFALVAALAIA
jgi:membrane associated rhomboid family serine protease